MPLQWEIARFAITSGSLAQLVEQGTFNPKVAGSIPSRPTTFLLARVFVSYSVETFAELGHRPMAGLWFLVPAIGVRIPVTQPYLYADLQSA